MLATFGEIHRLRNRLVWLPVLLALTAPPAASSAEVAVDVQPQRCGDTNLPFPRSCELRITMDPPGGRTIRQLSVDWMSDGRFRHVTPWHLDSAQTINLAFTYDAPGLESVESAPISVQVVDDQGKTYESKLTVELPESVTKARPQQRSPYAGIYTQWRPKEVWRRGNPPEWLAGWEVFAKWSEIEAERGQFQWQKMERQVRRLNSAGKNIILHVNADWPDWVFAEVGKSLKPGSHRHPHYPQFWDPTYWRLRDEFIGAYGRWAASLPSGSRIVAVRAQAWTVDPENIPSSGKDIVTVNRGKRGGEKKQTDVAMTLVTENFRHSQYPVDYSPELGLPYALGLRDAYTAAFEKLGNTTVVFKPNAGGRYGRGPWTGYEVARYFLNALANTPGSNGLFTTNGAPDGGQRSETFLGYVDAGWLRGLHETSGDRKSGGDPNRIYWTMLAQLHAGSEFAGLYGNQAHLLEYQADYSSEPLHTLINRYVGWKAYPGQAPGAFIALRGSESESAGKRGKLTGNYQAFIHELPGTNTTSRTEVGTVGYKFTGPNELNYPRSRRSSMLWTKGCTEGGALRFRVDPTFTDANDAQYSVRVTYFDEGEGSWVLEANGGLAQPDSGRIQKGNSGEWRQAVLDVRLAPVKGDKSQLTLHCNSQDTDFHLIELTPK